MARMTNLYQNPAGDWMGPRQRQSQRLFRYLGIQDPGDRRAFRTSARAGTLNQSFTDLPTTAKLFQDLIMGKGGEDLTGRKARRYNRLSDTAAQYGYVGGFDPKTAGQPTLAGPEVNAPPVSPNPPGTAPGPIPGTVPSTIEDMLKNMGGYVGPQGQQTMAQINSLLNTGGLAPGFQNMFQNLLAVHNREGEKNVAALNEAMGARGARYGSDILNAQSDMRRQQTQDLAQLADQLQLQLGQQQQGMLGLGQQSAQMEQAARENAMARMFQEYLTQATQLPPVFQQMMAALSGLPQSNTLAYTGQG